MPELYVNPLPQQDQVSQQPTSNTNNSIPIQTEQPANLQAGKGRHLVFVVGIVVFVVSLVALALSLFL